MGLCSPQLHLPVFSTLRQWCQETCTQDQTRTEPLRNAKAAEKPLRFLSYLLVFSILSLSAVFQHACTEQNHSVNGIQHLHASPQFRVLQREWVAQFSLPCEVHCLRPC